MVPAPASAAGFALSELNSAFFGRSHPLFSRLVGICRLDYSTQQVLEPSLKATLPVLSLLKMGL